MFPIASRGRVCAPAGGVTWPVDQFTAAAPLAVYATEALKTSWVGQNVAKIRERIGGDTQDFTAGADGKMSAAALLSFLGSPVAYPNREGFFHTLYDQSGNGDDATQATNGDQPSYLLLPDGRVTCDLRGSIGSNGGWFNTTGLSLTGQNLTVFMVWRADDRSHSSLADATGRAPSFGGLYGGNYVGMYESSSPALKSQWITYRHTADSTYFQRSANCHLQAASMCYGASNLKIINNHAKITNQAAASNNGAVSSFRIGRISSASIWSPASQLVALLLYPALTELQQQEMLGYLNTRFGVATWTHNVIFDGDSISAGYSIDDGYYDVRYKSWPSQLWGALPDATRASRRFINVARSGRCIDNSAGNSLNTDAVNKIDPFYDGATFNQVKNVVVIFAGTNDIGTATVATAAQTKARLDTYIAARKTAGYGKVVVVTPIPRQVAGAWTSGMSTALSDYRDLILADGTYDAVVDVGWTSTWNGGGGTDWTTNYQDGVHPNAAGRTIIVNAFLAHTGLPF